MTVPVALSAAGRTSAERAADPDAELVARCRQGDRHAFDGLLERHRGWVVNLAYQMLGAPDEAQDAAQEAFVRAFTHLKRFRGEATFATWLRRIIVNECLNRLAGRREQLTPAEMIDASAGGQAAVQHVTEALVVRAALQRLSPPLRAVIVLREMQAASYEEIAHILGIPTGTVRSRLAAAREKLRELLSGER